MLVISLRLAEESDCALLWRWRNEACQWSFNSAYIPYEEHRKWFINNLRSGNTKMLVVLDENKKEVGQVRLDIWDIDISIDAKERNKGYGSSALKVATEKFDIVIAHIKEGNEASISAFIKAGFKNKGLLDFEGHKAILMVLERK